MDRSERIEAAVEAAIAPFADGFQLHDLWDVVLAIMEKVEDWKDLASGPDKKQFVLEVVEVVLDKVDLPGPDFITKRVILWFLPSLIDKFVDIAKSKLNFA